MTQTNELQTDPRYPIGRFSWPTIVSTADRMQAAETISALPHRLREALRSLSDEQMDTPYREGGWTVRQLVHHLADSHMAAFHRLCRALTEEQPVVPGYKEAAFAQLADHRMPTESSLAILDGVHARWASLLQAMAEAQWQRTWKHSESGVQRLDAVALLYAWHCRHHLAHITTLRAQQGW